jgi:UDP-N-acetylglucosamine 2-epimerase (non-hydrolysing)
MTAPFPEEMNRVLTARMAAWHFAPTARAAAALAGEGVAAGRIFVTGNTVIDALLHTNALATGDGPLAAPGERQILVTLHRRENFGAPVARICEALDLILARNPDTRLVIPLHPNPNAGKVIAAHFGGRPRATLTPPLGYRDFVAAMGRAHLILSDSGGVQEEAPALGKPVLVLRDTTERPEAVEAGATLLVGTERDAIADAATHLLTDEAAYRRMARPVFPYGDGRAAERIADILAAA